MKMNLLTTNLYLVKKSEFNKTAHDVSSGAACAYDCTLSRGPTRDACPHAGCMQAACIVVSDSFGTSAKLLNI